MSIDTNTGRAEIAGDADRRPARVRYAYIRDYDIQSPPTRTTAHTGKSPKGDFIDSSREYERSELSHGGAWSSVLPKLAVALLTLGVLIGGWWALAVLGNYPPYILPTPPLVAQRAWELLLNGSLPAHFGMTFLEAWLGFLIALVVGTALGYRIAHSRLLERLVTPYIGVSQGLPIVAIAPLLVIWFKDDLARNAVVVALIVFFPIVVNTIVGLRSIDRELMEVARMSGANLWQTIRYVELPLSLRGLLAGVKLGLTLSITGAVVGELISANSGLGFLIAWGRSNFDTPAMFVGLVSLALLTMLFYAFITTLERALVNWE